MNLCAFNFNVYTIGCIIMFHSTKSLILVRHGDYMVFGISIGSYSSYSDINICKQSRLQKISSISIVIMREQIFNLAVCCFITCQIMESIWDISRQIGIPLILWFVKINYVVCFLAKSRWFGKHSISSRVMGVNMLPSNTRFKKEILFLK